MDAPLYVDCGIVRHMLHAFSPISTAVVSIVCCGFDITMLLTTAAWRSLLEWCLWCCAVWQRWCVAVLKCHRAQRNICAKWAYSRFERNYIHYPDTWIITIFCLWFRTIFVSRTFSNYTIWKERWSNPGLLQNHHNFFPVEIACKNPVWCILTFSDFFFSVFNI